ncbi:MAG: hypothetical protein LBS35_04835 [Synergistaceae bacterium]|jgi:hypothetical protein|nr:hypothetical protein [Synergistaceae bacterium]
MACFIVPTAEAIVVSIINQVVKTKEKNASRVASHSETEAPVAVGGAKTPFSRKLKWLSQMLWGGSFLLAFEHVWHGEVTPWFPFLTAASNPADTAEMLHEMSTAGVLMAVLVTLVWTGMVLVSNALEKRVTTAMPTTD